MWETILRIISKSRNIEELQAIKSGVIEAYDGAPTGMFKDVLHISGFRAREVIEAVNQRIDYLDSQQHSLDAVLDWIKDALL
ncbi:hypothetical protein J23TS9_06270 [Paenibacillus sp. J23TS9]|nr:hypothetical protein J23TS9_06270 [Paenibacillus sp. J23TS9]